MKTRAATHVARASNESLSASRQAHRQTSTASAALGASPRMTAQRQAMHAALGSRASLPGRSSPVVPKSLPSVARSASQPVIQAFWNLSASGKPEWVNGPNPTSGYSDSGRRKGKDQIVWVSDSVKAALDKAKLEEQEKLKAPLREEHAKRSHPKTQRRNFSAAEKKRLGEVPKVLSREDSTPEKAVNDFGQGKAHLFSKGLRTAGKVPLTATEQQDQKSPNKGKGNRISSKAPLETGKDTSNTYGTGKGFSIKARKLERARLRGKEDAQNVKVHTTGEILGELDRGPAFSPTGKKRDVLKGFAEKDREFHHSVGFHSPDDPDYYIPNRFLIRKDMPEIHDSDSESESEDEAEDPVVEPAVDLKEETEVADETVQDEEKDTALDTVTASPVVQTPTSGGNKKKGKKTANKKKKTKGRSGGRQ